MTKITEQPPPHSNLEQKSIEELTLLINQEDKSVPLAIEKELPRVQALIGAIVNLLRQGGRLFYVGAGSGGRLSVLDVIELPTTYGVAKGVFNVVLAGGIDRLADALEEMEDDELAGWDALQQHQVTPADIVIGISASGTTPFVLGALQRCRENKITTGCIVSNPGSPIAAAADYPVEVITGPEFITGSTRMKCGTAQKMLFDMISTTVMIRMGRVQDNKMVHVKLINNKIIDRSVRMLMELSGLADYDHAREALLRHGSVKSALSYVENVNR